MFLASNICLRLRLICKRPHVDNFQVQIKIKNNDEAWFAPKPFRPHKSQQFISHKPHKLHSAHKLVYFFRDVSRGSETLSEFWYRQCAVLLRSTRGQRCKARHEEVQAWEWHQIHLKPAKINQVDGSWMIVYSMLLTCKEWLGQQKGWRKRWENV